MDKKLFFVISAVALLAGNVLAAEEQNDLIVSDNTVIVCHSKQCKDARDMMTREFLYNKLGSLLKNNVNRNVSFCEADKNTHLCLNEALTFEANVGATPSTVYIPSALLVDTKTMRDEKTQKFVLDYDLRVGDTYPTCQASLNQLKVPSADEVSIETPGFECRFTESGMTVVNASYDVDYIDFDYGAIGAYYTIAAAQASKGGASGYVMLRFVNPANPNNKVMDDCGCVCNESQNPPCRCEALEPVEDVVIDQEVVVEVDVNVKTQESTSDVIPAAVADEQTDMKTEEYPALEELPTIVQKTVDFEEKAPVQLPSVEKATFVLETQILKPGVPVVMEVEEDVAPGQVRAVSNWDK